MSTPLLELRGVNKEFGGLQAVKDVSFAVPVGATIGVIGPNGAGKTTLFNLISGASPVSRGEILYDGLTITKWPAHVRARRGITRTFQTMHLYQKMSAMENVVVALNLRAPYSLVESLVLSPRVRRTERELRQEALRLLQRVGLEGKASALAGALSYGEQRRLDIAKALAVGPRLLLLDEPAAGMNAEEASSLAKLIIEIKQELKLTVVLVEHHMDFVMALSEKVVAMDFGAVIAEGSPEEIRRHPRVREAYIGQEIERAEP